MCNITRFYMLKLKKIEYYKQYYFIALCIFILVVVSFLGFLAASQE